MSSRQLTVCLIALGTVIGLAGIDLVLPAIPTLPETLGGNLETAQWVLAAFAAGTGIGLIVYGELGNRFNIGSVLLGSLFAYALLSWLATQAVSLPQLSGIRFFQGLVAAAPAVFAPVMIKSMYQPQSAIAMLGRIGSIESITPALAPVLGAWLLNYYGWKSSFQLTAAIALLLGIAWLLNKDSRQSFGNTERSSEGYVPLLRDRRFVYLAVGQAFTLGALLIIVFAAPTVIIATMDGSLSDFIVMQITGISFFIISANTSHRLIGRLGEDNVILFGSAMTSFGCIAIMLLGLTAKPSIELLWVLFVFVNLGLGIRGPVGFYRALQASGSNESRGSALIILFVMLTAAAGTALAAPFITKGLAPIAALASAVALISVWASYLVKHKD